MPNDDTDVTGGTTDTGTDSLDTTATTDSTADEGKTYTKAEVEELVEKRLIRERKKVNEASEKARIATLSDTERIIEEAKAEARAEVQRDNAGRLAAAEIKVALNGLVEDPESIIEDLDISRYIDEDNSVDAEAVNKLRVKYENLLGGKRKTASSGFQPGRTNQSRSETPQEAFETTMKELFR